MNRYCNIFVLIITGILFSFSGCKNHDVTGVTILPNICVVPVGETKQLTAIVSPDNADDKSVRWDIITLERTVNPLDTTNTQDVASISENGKVTGLAEGFASAVCITNNMFYEATANIMVGYATAVIGVYDGSLSENGDVLSTTAKIGIIHISEHEARLNCYPIPKDTTYCIYCDVTIEYVSERMKFSGTSIIDLQGTPTTIKTSGDVTLDGLGNFEIFVGDDPVTTYSFFGINGTRPF
jgi:hypothetical protein